MDQILLIDDDRELCELLEEYLGSEGFSVIMEHNGETGLQRALERDMDLLVLDIMLPGLNGFDILRKLRGSLEVPVIMLTAKGDEIDRIVGLEMGADDYLPKPFNPRELVARIRSILRRTGSFSTEKTGEDALVLGDLKIYPQSYEATLGGCPLELTGMEFRFLTFLTERAGKLVSRQELTTKVLERPYSPFDRSVDVHISNLRKKLGTFSGGEERIKTVRGEGYLYIFPKGREFLS